MLRRQTAAAPRVLDRALRAFADVRPGEGGSAVALAAVTFLVLGSYYLLKVVREPLILTGGAFGLHGAQLKSAAAAVQALLLLGIVPAYAALAARVGRLRLLNTVTLIFVGCLAAFAALDRAGAPLGLAFYVWLGIFNMMAVAQVWSFAADVYTPEQGQRLFAIVAFGGTAGAVAGSAAGAFLVVRAAPATIMLVAGVGLLAALGLINAIGTPLPSAAPQRAPSGGGFGTVLRHPYLLAIAALILVYTTVNTNGEYILSATVVDAAVQRAHALFPGDAAAAAAETRRIIGGFYGGYFSAQTVLTALLQLFVVGRLMQWLGVRAAIVVVPALAFGSSLLLAAAPVLALVRGAKIFENSVDYSLHNTVRQALFLPVGRQEKYAGKQAIDSFVVRFGDVASLAMVAVAGALGLGVRALAMANVIFAVVWVGLALLVGRRHRSLVAA